MKVFLKGFATASHGTEFAAYISVLEAFDRLEQLRELKALGLEYTGIGPREPSKIIIIEADRDLRCLDSASQISTRFACVLLTGLQPLFHGDYLVKLLNGAELTLSRSFRESFFHQMSR